MEVILVSVLGILLFGGLFILLGPEWWSSNLGTLKEKKKKPNVGAPQGDKTSKPAAPVQNEGQQVGPGPFGPNIQSRRNTPAQ